MKLTPPVSLQQISAWTGGELYGDPTFMVTGLNEIHMVETGDLTFVDHPKYYDKVLRSKASVVIINQKHDCPEGKHLIFSDDPFRDYVGLVRRFRCFMPSLLNIDPSAEIGEGTIVQPGAFIGPMVKIGRDCIIHANVSIYDHTLIGDHVIVHSNSVLGADAFYFKRRDDHFDKLESCGRVVIGDHVEIGACCTIDKGVSGDTIIGNHTKLDNHVQVGHDTVVGSRCLLSSHVAIAGVTIIEDDVILWGQVAIQKDIVIGKGAVVLAKSGVDKTLPGGKVYFGVPARESRTVWREMVMMKQLPDLIEKLSGK